MNKVAQYQKVQVMTSDGVRLIVMLYEGILRFNNGAKEAIEKGQIKERVYFINRSLDIVSELNNALNMEDGGEVAENLRRLYDYCVYSLNKANSENSTGALADVDKVISEVKVGWEGISSEKGAGDNVASDTDYEDSYTQGVASGGL